MTGTRNFHLSLNVNPEKKLTKCNSRKQDGVPEDNLALQQMTNSKQPCQEIPEALERILKAGFKSRKEYMESFCKIVT